MPGRPLGAPGQAAPGQAAPGYGGGGGGGGGGSGPQVTGSWSAAFSQPPAPSQPPPGTLSLQVQVASTGGDWMFAVIAWRNLAPGGGGPPAPSFSVSDDVHNWWEPLDAGASMSSASGFVRCSVWMAPKARAAGYVTVAPTGFSMAYAVTVYDVAGMQPWVSASAVSAYGTGAVSATLGAPASQAIAFTVMGYDSLLAVPSLAPGGGWSAVTSISSGNGTDDTADIGCLSAWQVTTGAVTASWSAAANLAEVTCAAVASAPALAPASPHWPVTIVEAALGAGVQTPPDQMTWTGLNAASLSLTITQGRQYETAQLSTGEGGLTLDNPAGLLIPPGSGPYAGINAGTPVRLRTAWLGGSWQAEFHGDGVTAEPYISTGQVFIVAAGTACTASAWLACSAPYPPGVALLISFCTPGGALISSAASAAVTTVTAALAIASGTAPAGTGYAAVTIQAAGTPASTVTFCASAAQPVP